jgi:hypothetical protein
MLTVNIQDAVVLPGRVRDLESFRRWACSADVPDDVRTSYLGGQVWVDMSNEQIFSHNLVKVHWPEITEPYAGGLLRNIRTSLDLAATRNSSKGGFRIIGAREPFRTA